MKFTGIILAGGKSSRMGKDKSQLVVQGKTMLEHAYDTLSPLCEEVLISSSTQNLTSFNAKIIPDNYVNKGPLGGLQACLKASNHEYALVLSCDAPFVARSVYNELIARLSNSPVLVSECAGREHPLIGIYNKKALPVIEESLKNDQLKLMDTLEKLKATSIEFPKDQSDQFTNINTPEELMAWNEK